MGNDKDLPLAAKTSGSGAVSPPGTTSIYTTAPPEIVFHYVTEDQLTMLEASNRDGLTEVMWGLFGIAGGAFIPTMRHVFDDGVRGINFLECLFFFVPFFTGIAILLISRGKKKQSSGLLSEIRNRQRILNSVVTITTTNAGQQPAPNITQQQGTT